MALRILLALLLAMLMMPAAMAEPGCHTATPAMHHDADTPAKASPAHACVGCVPLADWLGQRISAPIPAAAIDPVARIAPFDPGSAPPPALPPPRRW